jgi:hypothetical protein
LPPPFHGTQKRFQKIKLINLDEVRCVKFRLNCTPFFFDKPDQLPNIQLNFHLKAQSVRDSKSEHGLVQHATLVATGKGAVNTPASKLTGAGQQGFDSS